MTEPTIPTRQFSDTILRTILLWGLILGLITSGCGSKEKKMVRDRQWAIEYMRDITREHYATALSAAARSQMISRLPADGVKDYRFEKMSPSRSVETIKLLARLGVDMDVRTDGKTPLIMAVEGGYPSIVEALLKVGANPLLKDASGRTASDYARSGGEKEIIMLLDEALQNIYTEFYEISDPHRRSKADSLYHLRPIAKADSLKADSVKTVIVAEAKTAQFAEATPSSVAPAKKKINLGGVSNFNDYDEAPKLQSPVKPVYPPAAVEAGLQGSVLLEVEVLPTGRVGEVKVLKSVQSGAGGIDEAAVSAMKTARFAPARKAGYPVQTSVQISVKFKI